MTEASVERGPSWLLRPRLADVGLLQIGRGLIEHVAVHGSDAVIHGWILLPDVPLDSLTLYVDRLQVGQVQLHDRDGVAETFPQIPHARRSGFELAVPGESLPERGWAQAVAFARDEPAAVMTSPYRLDLDEVVPTPPDDLMMRVAHTTIPHFFKLTGLEVAADLLGAVADQIDLALPGRLLDWGCGCGRALWHIADGLPGWHVEGCDIDAEAVDWCRANVSALADCTAIPLMPPTEYEDEAFDVVTAYSVLTHLTAEAQTAWLRDMFRILRPGGVFAASIHGDFASSFSTQTALNVLRYGIDDTMQDHTLDAVAPPGYYRGSFQSSGYTLREYARIFELVDYRDRGASNFQDLVVMRKPG